MTKSGLQSSERSTVSRVDKFLVLKKFTSWAKKTWTWTLWALAEIYKRWPWDYTVWTGFTRMVQSRIGICYNITICWTLICKYPLNNRRTDIDEKKTAFQPQKLFFRKITYYYILRFPLCFRSPYLTPRVGLGGLNQVGNNMANMAKRFKPNGGGPSLSPTTTGESRRSSYEQASTPNAIHLRRGSAPFSLENVKSLTNHQRELANTEGGWLLRLKVFNWFY